MSRKNKNKNKKKWWLKYMSNTDNKEESESTSEETREEDHKKEEDVKVNFDEELDKKIINSREKLNEALNRYSDLYNNDCADSDCIKSQTHEIFNALNNTHEFLWGTIVKLEREANKTLNLISSRILALEDSNYIHEAINDANKAVIDDVNTEISALRTLVSTECHNIEKKIEVLERKIILEQEYVKGKTELLEKQLLDWMRTATIVGITCFIVAFIFCKVTVYSFSS